MQGPGTRLLMAGDALASKPTACWQRDFATTSQRPFRKRRVSEALSARRPVASGGGGWRSDVRRPEAPCGLSRAACPVSEASLHTVHRPVPQATRPRAGVCRCVFGLPLPLQRLTAHSPESWVQTHSAESWAQTGPFHPGAALPLCAK